MKEYYVSLLTTDEEIQDFFMVKNIAVKLGSNKKQYLDLLLGDNTGEITAKKWDVADTELPSLNEIKIGEIVKVKAQVTQTAQGAQDTKGSGSGRCGYRGFYTRRS